MLTNNSPFSFCSDIMVNFRKTVYDECGMDCFKFLTLPGLSYASMLKQTGVRLEQMSDPNMYLTIETGLRGGFCGTGQRYLRSTEIPEEVWKPSSSVACEAVVPQPSSSSGACGKFKAKDSKKPAAVLKKDNRLHATRQKRKKARIIRDFTRKQYRKGYKKSFIKYLDATALYSYAQLKKLPVGGYEWVPPHELARLFQELQLNAGQNIDENGDTGYIFVVTLSYPKNLHKKHAQFPILPVKREVHPSELSQFTLNSVNGQVPKSCQKLIADFNDRVEYPIHMSYLKLALKHGLVLKSLHCAIRFVQTDFIRPYIEDCMQKRALATNEFDKSFFKLKSNAGWLIGLICLLMLFNDNVPIYPHLT